MESMRQTQTILVVDDDAMVLRYVSATLKRYGYGVHQAASGNEGLQYFSENGAGLAMVLTDVVMPGMSGPEMIDRILALRPHMPVTFMTGTAADSRLHYRDAKACKMILKPFTPQKLLDAVRECLGSSAATGE
jgi:two-component system, cell cycle sensor histidine kinase and response regulator CckA